ncbi:MAG: hypothetical protein R6X02_06285 [Enhygromyxa sp.]
MTRERAWLTPLLTLTCAAWLTTGCRNDDGSDEAADETEDSGDGDGDPGDGDGDPGDGDGDGEGEPETAALTHAFGTITLAPFEETEPCVQWTLDNEAPLYVQAVTLSNLGYFHHSNWFVVPDNIYPGDDGFFKCSDRGFTELGAAAAGTVLFAQSTQSFVETQETGPGAIIKIPPHHKVIAGTHLLNVGPAEVDTELFMTLDLIHPRDVEIVLAPFRLSYIDLDIPANAESRFTGVCDDFAQRYEDASGFPLDVKLHYVLPHFHYLGNYFDLTLTGGPLDGESVYELEGFNGEANGGMFDPPLDLSGVEGLRFTCGYDNWRDVNVGWGIGDQEMCVMLGLAESQVMMDVSVTGATQAVGEEDGIFMFEGPCGVLAVPKNPSQSMPTEDEKNGPLNVPDSGDEGIPPVPECIDHDPSVMPELEPTLSNVSAAVFQASCTFNACHGQSGQAAGLNLQAPDLLTELLEHEVVGNPGGSLVEPGDPDNSWLYQVMSSCAPMSSGGGIASHMPRNAPILLDDRTIALVREWIADGANP